MAKSVALYGVLLGLGAFVLTWIEYQHAVRFFSTEIYIAVIALLFAGLGIWVGHRLTPHRPSEPFERNDKALEQLGISNREYEVLQHMAKGRANKQIARDLGVSPNTVKTQISSLLKKLDAARRTEAIQNARDLHLIP